MKDSVSELVEAARAVVAFNDPDSVADQEADPRLRIEAEAALDRLANAVEAFECRYCGEALGERPATAGYCSSTCHGLALATVTE